MTIYFDKEPVITVTQKDPNLQKKEPNSQTSNFLINDVVVKIFSFLNIEDFASVSRVCRQWNQCSKSPLMWRFFLKQAFNIEIKNSEQDQAQQIYKAHFITNKNVAKGIYRELILDGHSDTVTALDFSKKTNQIFSGSHDNSVKCWDAETGNLLFTLGGFRNVLVIKITQDGTKLVTSDTISLKIWALQERTAQLFKDHQKLEMSDFILYKNDTKIVLANRCENDQTIPNIEIWDVEKSELEMTLKGHTKAITTLHISKDENLFFSGSSDKTIRVWDLNSRSCLHILNDANWIGSLFYMETQKKLISRSGFNDSIVIYDLASAKSERLPDCGSGYVSEDQTQLFIACDNGPIKIFDFGSENYKIIPSDDRAFISLALSEDGKSLIGFCFNSAEVWDLQSLSHLYSTPGGVNDFFDKEHLIMNLDDGDLRKIRFLDFTASNKTILAQLAVNFMNERDVVETMRRFNAMPEKERNEIYIELDKILNDGQDIARGKEAFDKGSTYEQKAQAIQKHIVK